MSRLPRSRTDARVLVVGLGGLGAPAAWVLAAAGVGTLGLADDDVVDRSNLHRQILFSDADVGQHKVDATLRPLAARFPNARLEGHRTRLLPSNAVDLLAGYDLVVEGSDNFATKFLTADAARLAGVPVVHGAAVRFVGTAFAIAAAGRPCYRCLFEDIPRENAPDCSGAGVMGPVVGAVGAVLADLALALLEGAPGAAGQLVSFDGARFRRRSVPPRPDCPLCGAGAALPTIDAARYAPRGAA